MNKLAVVCVGLAALAAADVSHADEPPKRKIVPLRVHAVFATQQGDKKLSSAPYSFTCLATDDPPGPASGGGSVRIGTEVPIPVRKGGESSTTGGVDFQYRNVGTNIDCSAQPLTDGSFLVSMRFEQSSVVGVDVRPLSLKSPDSDIPLFKTRVAVVRTVFRDGQKEQAWAATDTNTGETATLDVTVTVMK